MKKYNINQEIPVPPPMPEDIASPVEHMLSSIDHQHEFDQEEIRLDAKIESLRQAVSDVDSYITSAKEMCDRMVELAKVIETGCSKLGEIADYITDLKQQIENMVIPAKITPDSFEEVKKRIDDLIYKIPCSGVISRPAASTSCRSFFITSAGIHLRSTLTVRTRLRLRTMSIGA